MPWMGLKLMMINPHRLYVIHFQRINRAIHCIEWELGTLSLLTETVIRNEGDLFSLTVLSALYQEEGSLFHTNSTGI